MRKTQNGLKGNEVRIPDGPAAVTTERRTETAPLNGSRRLGRHGAAAMMSESEDLPLPVFVIVCDAQTHGAERERSVPLFCVMCLIRPQRL